MNEIMVSVWCATYNHEKYIGDAIEGFLTQNTDFSYEVYIFDDASTDETANIIKKYEKKYPDIIKGIYQKENLYSKTDDDWHGKKSIMQKVLRGKYVAVCEGDDYWTDPDKLQMQVDYMENHRACVMTAHDATMINCITGERKRMSPYKEEKDISADEVIMQYHGHIPAASIMYRKEILDISDFFVNIGIGDYPLQLYCLTRGQIHFFNKEMSVYRFCGAGAWTNKLENDIEFYILHYIKMIFFLEQYDFYTKCIFTDSLTRKKWIYLQYIISKCHDYTSKQFIDICELCNRKSYYKFERYFREIERIFRLFRDEDYADKVIQTFICSYQHIVIWGAGKYGEIVAHKIQTERNFEGFVVSNDHEKANEYLGKPVWRIADIPFNKSETGIIVAVNINSWYEIQKNLDDIENTNYIYPFVIQNY